MSRKTARRHAFHLIYQIPFHLEGGINSLAELKAHYFDFVSYGSHEELGFYNFTRPAGRDAEYIDKAVWGVFEKQAELDGVIEKFLKGWTIDRISKVDLALLRLSIYEMITIDDVPLGVAVNEAINLAKEYGSDESPAFINGVLGGVSKAIQAKDLAGVG